MLEFLRERDGPSSSPLGCNFFRTMPETNLFTIFFTIYYGGKS